MQKFLLSILALAFASNLSAQCVPDPAYADSIGVFPLPYDAAANPDGGIKDCAIIGENFEFVFTVAVSDTFTFGGFPLPLDSVVVNNVLGLPAGLNYACSPGNCHFKKNTSGCAVITGTPTAANAPGDYDLTIEATIYTASVLGAQMLSFPNDQIAPGKYTIKVLAAGSAPCISGTNERLASQISITTQPNPTSGDLQININSKVTGEFEMQVVDLLGNKIHRENVAVLNGANTLQFDGSHLPNGIYLLTLRNGSGIIAQKFTVQH